MRKLFAVWARLGKTTSHKGEEGETAEELFAKVALADKHRLTTAEAVYACITPEEYAQLSKHCFLRLMGEPIPFPSMEEWTKDGRTMNDILLRGGTVVEEPSEDDYELERDLEELMSDVGESDEEGDDHSKRLGILAAYEASQGEAVNAASDAAGDEAVKAHAPSESSNAVAHVTKATRATSSREAPNKICEAKSKLGPKSRRLVKRLSDEIEKQRAKERKKRETKKARKAAQMSDDDSDPVDKRKRSVASGSTATGSATVRHTTQANTDAVFKVKEAPKAEPVEPYVATLCDEDIAAIALTSKGNAEIGGNKWTHDEKVFLVNELRTHQLAYELVPSRIPAKAAVLNIIDHGVKTKCLLDPYQGGTLSDEQAYQRVYRFYSKFLAMMKTSR